LCQSLHIFFENYLSAFITDNVVFAEIELKPSLSENEKKSKQKTPEQTKKKTLPICFLCFGVKPNWNENQNYGANRCHVS